jgi:threonine-phosphate decarboxylase
MEGPVLTPSALAAQLTRADGATTTVIYLGNPNNPTSTVLSRAEILELATTAAAHRAWLVVDEAFVHFLEPPGAADAHWSVATLAPGLPNLLVVGSLTKLFAFPGLRVGYVVGAPAIIEELDARRDPWTVGALAQAAAVAALGSWDYLGETRRWLSATRSGFASALAALPGVRVGHEPQANFVLFEVTSAGLDAAAVVEALGRRGILLRDASNFPGLGRGYLRSAIRTRPQNYRLLRALGAVCGGR